MGSEEKKDSVTGAIHEEGKALAVKVYEDAAAPSVRAVGGTAGRLVRLALKPLEMLATIAERYVARVEEKLQGVPADRLLPPPATIVGPAALHYALLGDGDEVRELREMFENLLAASMDRSKANSVHPAFVNILSQVTPDEAWILKSITDPLESIPILEVRQMLLSQEFDTEGFVCDLGIGIGVDEDRQPQYLSNLQRLGVIDFIWDRRIAGDVYEGLRTRMRGTFKTREGRMLVDHPGILEVTPLGAQFWRTCIRSMS